MINQRTMTAWRVLLAAILVLAAGGIAPDPASAHNYGHTCPGRIARDGFACRTVRPTSDIRGIETFYNGSLRGSARVFFAPGSSRGRTIWTCDYNYNDSISPRLRIQELNGDFHEYVPNPAAQCSTNDLDYSVRRYRVIHRTPSGGINHGTVWYTRTTG